MLHDIKTHIAASIATKEALLNDEALLRQLARLIEASVASLRAGGKIIFAGNGGSFADAQHLSAELFNAMANVKIVRVAYKGSAQGLVGLAGGETHMMISTASSSVPHMKSGKVRALAVTSAQPSALAPGLPTVSATGLPGYEVISVDAVFARAKTSSAIVNRLNQEIARALAKEDLKLKFFSAGSEVAAGPAHELGAFVKSEIAKWGKVIRQAGIRVD